MECVNIKYCRKIRFYPTNPQIEYFKKCFGTTRYLYNKTIKMYNQEKFKLNIITARSIIMKNNKDMNDDDPDSDTLTAILATNPIHGKIVLNNLEKYESKILLFGKKSHNNKTTVYWKDSDNLSLIVDIKNIIQST